MFIENIEDYDSAILLLMKGDEIHVKVTENLSPEQFMELLVAVSLSLQGVLEEADGLISRTLQ